MRKAKIRCKVLLRCDDVILTSLLRLQAGGVVCGYRTEQRQSNEQTDHEQRLERGASGHGHTVTTGNEFV